MDIDEHIRNTYAVNIPGKFRAKGRPRFARVGNYVRTFTPADTVEYEHWVRQCWMEQALTQRFDDDLNLKAFIMVWFPIPKSASKKKRQLMLSGVIRPTRRPDADNISKTILDSLVGVAYRDDSQVTTLTVVKRYGEIEGVDLIIKEDN